MPVRRQKYKLQLCDKRWRRGGDHPQPRLRPSHHPPARPTEFKMRIAGETKTDDNDKPLNSAVYVLTSEPLRFSEIGRPAEDVIKPVGDTFTTPATKDKEDVVVDRWGIPVEAGGNPERP